LSRSVSRPDKASNSSLNLVLIFLFLAYFSIAPQILFAVQHITGWSGVRDALLYSIPWLLVPIVVPKFTRPWLILVGCLAGLVSCIKIGYYAIYSQEISQSVFMAAMETNPQELVEFLEIYFRWWIPVLLLVYIAPAIVIFRFIQQPQPTNKQRIVVLSLITLLVAVPLTKHAKKAGQGWSRLAQRYEVVEPFGMLQNFLLYRANLAESEGMLEKMRAVNKSASAIRLKDTQQKQTYVLVIGESTNRQRLGLYGYERETSPELQKISQDLLVYQDVVAAIPYTIESLSTALTFAGLADFHRAFSYMNIVTLMQHAGFKVYWITNQQTLSQRNTLLTAFASLADEVKFLNNNRNQHARQPDEIVFPAYQKALADSAEKKLIIVHLLGTHFRYDYRYPESFEEFTGEVPAGTQVKSADDKANYNAYDNAVRYNDYVVAHLIADYQRTDPYGALVYFSDHGEEVFDVQHFNGRNGGLPSTNMYTVPFLMWPSPSWREQRDIAALQSGVQQPYSLSWFLHSWCDLVKIEFTECKPERSIFSSQFKPVTRWMGASIGGKPANYDQLAEKEKQQKLSK
jgi:heptose-I-phosphate ethanolaminephosphotransferase